LKQPWAEIRKRLRRFVRRNVFGVLLGKGNASGVLFGKRNAFGVLFGK